MKTEGRREEGMLTVEAVLGLVPFILAIMGIISFINIFAVHNKIQFALYQMGNELSCYTYFYQVLGVRGADLGLKKDIDAHTAKLDSTIHDLNEFLDQLGAAEGRKLAGSVRELASDPKALLRGFVYLGIEEIEGAAKSLLIKVISDGLIEVYLDESFSGYHGQDADSYLKYFGVKNGISGLDFGKSQMFQDQEYRMIDIVVEYDLEIHMLKLFLKDPTFRRKRKGVYPDGHREHGRQRGICHGPRI